MKSFSSPANPWIQEQGLGLCKANADWTARRLFVLIASQQPGRRKMQVRSNGQKVSVRTEDSGLGKAAERRVRRTSNRMMLMPMLKAMLSSNSSKIGMISVALTQGNLRTQYTGSNGKFTDLWAYAGLTHQPAKVDSFYLWTSTGCNERLHQSR